MIVDRGPDFPVDIERRLLEYGSEMWMFRYQPDHRTTRALNSFRGEHRRWEIYHLVSIDWNSVVSFEYKTPRIRLSPADLEGTKLAKTKMLHFVCSPSRALSIISEFNATWKPITIYEPIPVRWRYWPCWRSFWLFCPSKICCVPDELDELTSVLRSISIFRYVSLIGVPCNKYIFITYM